MIFDKLTEGEAEIADSITAFPGFDQMVFRIGLDCLLESREKGSMAQIQQRGKELGNFFVSKGWNNGECLGTMLIIMQTYCIGIIMGLFKSLGQDTALEDIEEFLRDSRKGNE